VRYRYVVRAVSLRGLESAATAPVEAVAKLIVEPIATVQLAESPQIGFHDGQLLPGTVVGPVQVDDEVLDLRQGGHVTFPHDSRFDLTQPLSIECWVKFDEPGTIPVVVSCGVWPQAGWFLQRLGNTWRWHVGGLDCDGGHPGEGRWMHLAATWDGQTARLFENGVQVGERGGSFNTAVWPGLLHLGQYSGGPAAQYQVHGRMAGVRLYHRSLEAEEAAAAARVPPP
jgi:hypothetical protein